MKYLPVVRFRPLVKGNEDPGYEGGLQTAFRLLRSCDRNTSILYFLRQNEVINVKGNGACELLKTSCTRALKRELLLMLPS